ncbi:hypothetical protein ACQHIV_06215 [Kribbella sp. GL6]|uniref:hypothetical protein n=1 Tax=Kribbella sp. GL6 TaxID=3419765 RepID=UPI003D066154
MRQSSPRHVRRRPPVLKVSAGAAGVVLLAGFLYFGPLGPHDPAQAPTARSTPGVERTAGTSRSTDRPSLPVGKPLQPLSPPSPTRTDLAPPWSTSAPAPTLDPSTTDSATGDPSTADSSTSAPSSTATSANPSTPRPPTPTDQPTPGPTSNPTSNPTGNPTTPRPTTPSPSTTPTTPTTPSTTPSTTPPATPGPTPSTAPGTSPSTAGTRGIQGITEWLVRFGERL